MTTTDLDPTTLDWLSLEADEELLWAAGPDRRTLVPAFVIGIPLSIILVGIVIIASEYLRVTNTHYVLTDQALYRKTGTVSRDVKRIEHTKVQDISYSQSAVGNYFGYGTVEITTAGGSGVELSFRSVRDPRSVQGRISELVDRDGSKGETRPTDDVLDEILTELRAIREAVDGPNADRARDISQRTGGSQHTSGSQRSDGTDSQQGEGSNVQQSGGDVKQRDRDSPSEPQPDR